MGRRDKETEIQKKRNSQERKRSRSPKDENKSKKRNDSSQSSSSSSERSSNSSSLDNKKEAEEILEQNIQRNKLIERELGYTKEENPFGDKNLNETILQNWGSKKRVKTFQENENDILHIKAIRQQRLEDERRMEEERTRQQREREEENYQQWKQKEESFHAYQARIRALVRITQGKETTTDKINKIFYIYRGKIRFSEHLESVMKDIKGFLKKQEEEELIKILAQAVNHHNQLTDSQQVGDQQFKSEEEIQRFASFWESVKWITQFYIDEIKRHKEHREVLPEFEAEVKSIFDNKNIKELTQLEKDIHLSIQQCQFEEQEYWQNMIKRLQLYKGDLILKEFFEYFVENQKYNQEEDALEIEVENKVKLTEEQILAQEIYKEQEMADAHVYSPILIQSEESMRRNSQTQEEFEDQVRELRQIYYNKLIKRAVQALQNKKEKESKFLVDTSVITKQEKEDIDAATLRLLEIERKKPMEEDETVFDDVQNINISYEWADKVKSKKPKYFNRVKQGFDWNKYNQMHYDADNPPPKYIQGYKFNIFFPELADSEKVPDYYLEPTDDPNYCTIRFSAGPPYEDIAFKILNKEWDYADKKGFKCFFNRGVLTLHFNFKRNRYRR